MPYQIIQDFRYGIDLRRSKHTSVIGTLLDLIDGHINEGAEIENRAMFKPYTLPTGTLGLQETAAGLVVFGAGAQPTEFNSPGYNIVTPQGSIAVLYQRLRRYCSPQNYMPEATLSSVICSTCFKGKSFVIALMSDNTVCLFYDGTAIPDSYLGYVFPTMTKYQVMEGLAEAVNQSDYFTGTWPPLGTYIDVEGQPGFPFTLTPSPADTSLPWYLTVSTITEAILPSVGKKAIGSFRIVAGVVGAGTIAAVKVDGVSILTGAVDFVTDAKTTAEAVVAACSASANYTLEAVDDTVRVIAKVVGTAANGKAVSVELSSDTSKQKLMIGDCSFDFPAASFTINSIIAGGATDILGAAKVFTSGGGTTLDTFLGTVATAINAGSATHGYCSMNVGNRLYISKIVTSSADASVPIVVDATENVEVVTGHLTVKIVPSPVPLHSIEQSGTTLYQGEVKAVISGGSGKYDIQWGTEAIQRGDQAQYEDPKAANTIFYIFGAKGEGIAPAGSVTITVTDKEVAGSLFTAIAPFLCIWE